MSGQATQDTHLLSSLIDIYLKNADATRKVRLYSANAMLDVFAESAMLAANPAYGSFLDAISLQDIKQRARTFPSLTKNYRHAVLNQRADMI